jgi:hypothetical protein
VLSSRPHGRRLYPGSWFGDLARVLYSMSKMPTVQQRAKPNQHVLGQYIKDRNASKSEVGAAALKGTGCTLGARFLALLSGALRWWEQVREAGHPLSLSQNAVTRAPEMPPTALLGPTAAPPKRP